MSDILKILLHLSTLKKTVQDVEKLVQDLIERKPIGDDAKRALADLIMLITADIITIPGLAKEDVIKAVNEVSLTISA